MAHTLNDTEFGAIRVKRVHAAKHVRLRIGRDGSLIATMPKRAPLILVKNLVNDSRERLRSLIGEQTTHKNTRYIDNDRVGASHTLAFIKDTIATHRVKFVGQNIIILIPEDDVWSSTESQKYARNGVTKALKKEAHAYLPRRLLHLANIHDFEYVSIRYTNAKSRWGSCSSSGTISLNIALMLLPVEIIDYILLHELCHTKEMNHSEDFWAMVENVSPEYKSHRKKLKEYSPYL